MMDVFHDTTKSFFMYERKHLLYLSNNTYVKITKANNFSNMSDAPTSKEMLISERIHYEIIYVYKCIQGMRKGTKYKKHNIISITGFRIYQEDKSFWN